MPEDAKSTERQDAAPTLDPVLAGAEKLARESLIELVPAEHVGRHVGCVAEDDHVATHSFECLQSGYPGWVWSVTLARLADQEHPTVVESELVASDSALVAPPWVPWSQRLAEYQAQQAEAAEAAQAAGSDDDDDDDIDDVDEHDLGDDGDDEFDGIDIESDDDDDDDDEFDGDEGSDDDESSADAGDSGEGVSGAGKRAARRAEK